MAKNILYKGDIGRELSLGKNILYKGDFVRTISPLTIAIAAAPPVPLPGISNIAGITIADISTVNGIAPSLISNINGVS